MEGCFLSGAHRSSGVASASGHVLGAQNEAAFSVSLDLGRSGRGFGESFKSLWGLRSSDRDGS